MLLVYSLLLMLCYLLSIRNIKSAENFLERHQQLTEQINKTPNSFIRETSDVLDRLKIAQKLHGASATHIEVHY